MSDSLALAAGRDRPDSAGPPVAGPWAGFRALLRWNLAQIGPLLPLVIVIQALLAAGIILGFGFLIPAIDPGTALFLSTGAPTVVLLTVGLVIVPQGVSRGRADGTFDYARSLPLARPLLLFADLTIWLLIALPGVVAAMLVARLRYDITLRLDWPILVLATLLVTVMATSVGYALAVSLQPMLAQLLTQILVFFVLLFSPVTFPASQLPPWFRSLHDVLPVRPGADLLRAGLAAQSWAPDGRDVLVLLAWTLAGVTVSLRALVRRG